MHKGVILLIKASQRDEAKDKVQEFMVQYGDGDIWDWYVIGGSPCQSFSRSGDGSGFDGKSKLFWEYVRVPVR